MLNPMILWTMKLKIFTLNSITWGILVFSVIGFIYIFTHHIYEPRIVYACSEVNKNDPVDVQKLCERLTKRRILE
jgi:hypothetical protein